MEGSKFSPEQLEYELSENRNPLREAVKEFCFGEEKTITIRSLGQKEGRAIVHGNRFIEEEAKLCNCKKKIEVDLLGKKPEEAELFWQKIKDEYCANYASSLLKGEDTELPKHRRRLKNRTILDEGEGNESSIAIQKAERSFFELKKGITREVAINKILNSISEIKAEISNSEQDINNKIDIIAYLDKPGEAGNLVIVFQIKGREGEYTAKNGETVEEVQNSATNNKKLEFFQGSERFEKKLREKTPVARTVKIWISVSDSDIINDGDGYKKELKIEIESRLKEILKNYIV